MSTPYIETRFGGRFDLLDPQPRQVRLDDIAHALSHLCRYTGHCSTFWSVAQHSLLVANLVAWSARQSGMTPDDAARLELAGLLHDAPEAYLGDVATPLKKILPEYQRIEANVAEAVERRFGLPVDILEHPFVKTADRDALVKEASLLLPDAQWIKEYGTPTGPLTPLPYRDAPPAKVRSVFIKRANALTERIK